MLCGGRVAAATECDGEQAKGGTQDRVKTEAKGPGLSLLLDILSSHYIVPTPTWIAIKTPK